MRLTYYFNRKMYGDYIVWFACLYKVVLKQKTKIQPSSVEFLIIDIETVAFLPFNFKNNSHCYLSCKSCV